MVVFIAVLIRVLELQTL